MLVKEQIHEKIEKLPTSFQAEVLDFIQYLLVKLEREAIQESELDWSNFSLASAMRDMEDENAPAYTMDDLKVIFK